MHNRCSRSFSGRALGVSMALALLAMLSGGCGGGGNPGTGPDIVAPTDVTQVNGTTSSSNGVSTVALPTGGTFGVRLLDYDTGAPVTGLSPLVLTDGAKTCIIVIDPSGKYAPLIVNGPNLGAATAGTVGTAWIGLIEELYLAARDHFSHYEPVALNHIDNKFARFIVAHFFTFYRRATLGEIGFSEQALMEEGITSVTEWALERALELDTGPIGWAVSAWEVTDTLGKWGWASHYRADGYADDQPFEIWRGTGLGLPATTLVVLVLPTEAPRGAATEPPACYMPPQADTPPVLPPPGTGAVALTFVIDDTGSMGGTIDGVKSSVQALVDSLAGRSLTWAGVAFKDEIHTTFAPSSDAAAFEAWIGGLYADGGGDEDENPLDALMAAKLPASDPSGVGLGWTYPSGAERFFIVFTDNPAHLPGDGGDAVVHFTGSQVLSAFDGWATIDGVTSDFSHSWLTPAGTRQVRGNNGAVTPRNISADMGFDIRELIDGGPPSVRTSTGTGGTWMPLPSDGYVDLTTLPRVGGG